MINDGFKQVLVDMYDDITNLKTKEAVVNQYAEAICENFPFIEKMGINKCLGSNKYLQATKGLLFTTNGLDKVNLTNKQVIDLTREVIESINPSFLNKFNFLLETNRIKIKKSFIFDNILKTHPAVYDRKYHRLTKVTSGKIKLYKNPDYYSVCTLIHEFMHVLNHMKEKLNTNLDDNKNIRTEFTEFISIFFEFYARDYLMKKYNLNNNQFDFSERFISSESCAEFDLRSYLPLLCYKEYGKINYTSFVKAIDDFNLELEPDSSEYNEVIKTAYKDIRKTKDMVIGFDYYKDRDEKVSSNYDSIFLQLWNKVCEDNYVLNSLLFFGTHDILTKEDVLAFSDIITENDGDLSKFRKEKFKLFINYYIKMLDDENLCKKTADFISNIYTKDGKLKKFVFI